MNRAYFPQFICKPSRIVVKSKVIPILSAIMICLQFTPALCADFTGNWSGTWSSDFGGTGSITANVTQTGTSLTGIISLTNTACGNFYNLSLTGSVNGNVANFNSAMTCSLNGSYNQLAYTNGMISGNTVTGDYTVNGSSGYYDSGTFSITRPDIVPDPFAFVAQTGVALNTVVTSNTITVSGIVAAAPISITGGTCSVNGGGYTSSPSTVNNGNTVTVRVTSSGSYLTTVNATLTIGGVSGTFSATTMAYSSPSDYFDRVQKVFIGYYQRPAAVPGLVYWSNQLDSVGGDLSAIIAAFANSDEAQRLYGPINSGSFTTVLTDIFQGLFNRPPAQAGLDYYLNGFNQGLFTPATIMLNVLDGATGTDLQTLNNKLAACNIFTKTINPELDGSNFQVTYTGDTDAYNARHGFLAPVTYDPATIPTRDETTVFMQHNIADLGDPILSQAVSLGDLTGMWEVNGVTSPTASWERGPLTIYPNGSFSGTLSESDGSSMPISGAFSVTSDGIITATGAGIPPLFQCTVDSGKSIMACTFTVVDISTDANIMVFTKKGASYSLADLSGTWETNEFRPSLSWWARGSGVVGSDGSFSFTSVGSDGFANQGSGALSITPDGVITATGTSIPPNYRCVMDSGKSVVVCTSHGNNASMEILTRKAVRYYLGDVSGTWEMNSLTSSEALWTRGPMLVRSDGSFLITVTESDGSDTLGSGTFSITPDGIITATGAEIPPSFQCTMDSGISVMACTMTDSDGHTDLMIFTKKPVPYVP